MSPRSYSDYFQEMYEATGYAFEFTAGLTFDQLAENTEKLFAVLRALEVIGDAAHRIPESVQVQYARLPWREMIAMRNVVIDEYSRVDKEVIWRTVQEDLPGLQAELAKIIDPSRNCKHVSGISVAPETVPKIVSRITRRATQLRDGIIVVHIWNI